MTTNKKTIDLDTPCGQFFTFRDFIECGEAWERLGAEVDNLPKSLKTVESIQQVCNRVLDPVVREFGQAKLTYGFSGTALAKHIPARIYPSLDQHAGSETTKSGKLVCSREGMAVDFCVKGVSSRELMSWIADHTQFDRMYFYGDDRPIHVSVGPENSHSIVHMLAGPSGRLVPRVMSPKGRLVPRIGAKKK